MSEHRILTLNSGSSSLKFSVYEMGPCKESLLLQGKLERIGAGEGHFEATRESASLVNESVPLPDHQSAIHLLLERLPSFGLGAIEAVGHRIVQGGPHHVGPELVTPELLDELQALCPLDPPHLPAALQALEAVRKLGEDIPQVVCFDTSFHRTLPAVAQQLPLPRKLTEGTSLMRYGFHGLSYESIMAQLAQTAGPELTQGKIIIAHLGNGASMAAVRGGQCVETTMGFTPASGLVMGSRTGDLDPGVLLYLLREGKVTADKIDDFIYQQCGLKGVSDLSSDLRDLLEASSKNVLAKMAVDLFCYQARKAMGALVAVMDGVDTIVFTGGIGEHAALPRAAICAGLHHLGLEVASASNERNDEGISTSASRIKIRVMKTNEERVIARHTVRIAFASSTE